MLQTTRTYIGGVEVRVGVRISAPSNRDRLAFAVGAVCDALSPERWHGEVSYNGTVLMSTDPVGNFDTAVRSAEAALDAKVVQLFSD